MQGAGGRGGRGGHAAVAQYWVSGILAGALLAGCSPPPCNRCCCCWGWQQQGLCTQAKGGCAGSGEDAAAAERESLLTLAIAAGDLEVLLAEG